MLESVNFLGLKVTKTDPTQLIDFITQNKSKNLLINYLNVYGFNLAYENQDFKKVLNQSNILFCDGFGIKLVAKMLGKQIGSRMTPPDWIDDLFAKGSLNGNKFFFLGDEAHVVSSFKSAVMDAHPNVEVAGFHHGFFLDSKEQEEEVLDLMKSADPSIVLVGLGMPRQEMWASLRSQEFSHVTFISVGALFRWYSNIDKRAPSWVTSSGLEWLARLIYQPNKVWKRYVFGIPLFFYRVLKSILLRRK
jgi:N-acetylglucosaminyldiphosphoundecaprenol N-acetyl-beta-D-mannosaminyltransferase